MPTIVNTMTTSLNIFERALNACYYSVKIPITKEGLLINIGPPNKHFEKLMPLYSCTFQGFRKLSNGDIAEVEKQCLIHEIGDWIIKVDHQPTEKLTFVEVKELLHSKILERRQSNSDELQVTFASISNVFRDFTHSMKNHRLKQNRTKKNLQRDQLSEEKKEEIREKDKRRKQLKRSMMSPKEKEEWRAKDRIYQRERWMNQSEEQKEEERMKLREYKKERRQNQIDEEKEEE